MRIVGMLAVLALAGAAATGCKAKDDADAATAPDPQAIQAQQNLLKRRDSLLNARQTLAKEHEEIVEKIKQSTVNGQDVTALNKRLDEIEGLVRSNNEETTTLLKDAIPATPPPPSGGDKTGNNNNNGNAEVTRQLQELARLEDLARQREREAGAAMAKALEAADKFKDSCSIAASPVVVQQVQVPKGQTFTKADISPLIAKAHKSMANRGIRGDDLGPASSLEAESNKAMGEGDWGRAYGAALNFASTVESIKIDKPFVNAKFGRLKQFVDGHKDSQAQAAGALSEIAAKYGDGDFPGANARINQLWSTLGR